MIGATWAYAVKGYFRGKRYVRCGPGRVKYDKQLRKSAFRSQVRQTLHVALTEENYDDLDFTPRRCFTDWDVW